MTQENKDLLLKDLIARLPYGVKCAIKNSDGYHHENIAKIGETTIDKLKGFDGKYFNIYHDDPLDWNWFVNEVGVEDIKPYLFPLSCMNEEQENEWDNLHFNPLDAILEGKFKGEEERLQLISKAMSDPIHWCYKNHFDCNGLIPLGLAIDATNLNIY